MVSANQLISLERPHFSPHSTVKLTIKVQISRKMASIGISDVVTASVYSEKTRMKKLMKGSLYRRSDLGLPTTL